MSEFPNVSTGDYAIRQVLSDHPDRMSVVFWCAAPGAIGARHNHPQVQSAHVASGQFRFTTGDEESESDPGDSFVIASGQTHGCACLMPGTLVDSFIPRRADFV